MSTARRGRRNGRRLWLVAAAVTLVLAGIVGFHASSQPDGLEKVAEDQGFLDTATEHDLADTPLADYGVEGVDDDRLSVGLAGVVGVALTLALGGGLFWLVRRRGGDDDGDAEVRGNGTPVGSAG